MIVGFRHRGLKRLYERGDKSQVRADMLEKIERVLAMLNRVSNPEELELPGYRLHPLKGDRAGQWAITVRSNWRIVFRFDGPDVTDIDLVDYH